MVRKILVSLSIATAVLSAGVASAEAGRAQPAATRLYALVAGQIDRGTIDATVALSSDAFALAGVWIEPGRHTTAAVQIVAAHGKVDRGTVRFEPPLIAIAKQQRFQIEQITVGAGGQATDLVLANRPPLEAVPPQVRAALAIQGALSPLLSGVLFQVERKSACQTVGTPCRTAPRVVSRIEWTAHATMLDSTWRLVDESQSDCLSFSTAQAAVHVTRAEYQTVSAETWIELGSDGFNLKGRSCAFVNAPQLRLNLVGGSFTVPRIAAQYQPPIAAQPAVDQAELRLGGGTLELAEGSELDLAQDSELVEHIIVNRGSLRFANLAIALRAGKAIALDLTSSRGGDASAPTALDARLGSSTLRMWRKSRTTVRSGRLQVPITMAHWGTSERPVIVSDERGASIDVELGDGVFQWNDDTWIPSRGGHVQGDQLSFDGRRGTGFVGTLARVEITSGDGGQLRLPGSFALEGMKPTELHASDLSSPVVIAALDHYPQGRIALKGIAAMVTSTSDKSISCENSRYDLDIVFTPDGYQLVHPLHCEGDYTVDVVGNRLRGTVDLEVDLLQLGPGGLSGRGKLSVSISAGTALDIAIPPTAPHVDPVGFLVDRVQSHTPGISFAVALRDPVSFSGNVTITGQRVSFGPSVARPRISIRLPADVEAVTADVEFGEVLVVRPPPCTYHMFLERGEYETAATFQLQVEDNVATVRLDHMAEFQPALRHHESGCELAMVVIDVVVAGLLPVGVIGAELIRGTAVDQLVAAQIVRRTQEFSKELARRDLTPILSHRGGS